MWFEGPKGTIPAIGVPSASAVAHGRSPAAAYNLFSIEREGEAWRCEQTVRGIDDALVSGNCGRCGYRSWRAPWRQKFRKLASSARPNSASAPTTNPNAKGQNRPRRGCSTASGFGHRGRDQRVFALDHAARHIIGNGVDDSGDIMGLGDHDAAEPGVLHEAIDALVAPHHHMRHHIDPQPRRIALADAAIEQVDLVRHLGKQRVQRLVQNFEPGHFSIAQIDDDAGAIRGLDPRLAQGIAQPNGTRFTDRLASGIWRV